LAEPCSGCEGSEVKELPIISVKEARRLLGKDAKDLDDDQIIEIVNSLTELAKHNIDKKGVKKSNNSLGL
jgi:ribonuclease HIII